jgi:hypothetical protein
VGPAAGCDGAWTAPIANTNFTTDAFGRFTIDR